MILLPEHLMILLIWMSKLINRQIIFQLIPFWNLRGQGIIWLIKQKLGIPVLLTRILIRHQNCFKCRVKNHSCTVHRLGWRMPEIVFISLNKMLWCWVKWSSLQNIWEICIAHLKIVFYQYLHLTNIWTIHYNF